MMKLMKIFLIIVIFSTGCSKILSSKKENYSMGQIDISKLKQLEISKGISEEGSELVWYDAKELTVEGKGWNDTENFYERLPEKSKDIVTRPVWDLSKNTAGIAIRFVTNSKVLGAIWDGGEAMNHMAATGNSGLDLYRKRGNEWIYAGTGRPQKKRTVATISSNLNEYPTEYLLYLPLYNKVTELKIGIEKKAIIAQAPPRKNKLPIVFYGTSITQGGCASRAGMCHPAILGRWFDREVINLGFSGAGKMELAMAELLGELKAELFVLECLPNMTNEMVKERVVPFVQILRKKHPTTNIILTENILYKHKNPQNISLREAYDKLKKSGVKNIYYMIGENHLKGEENGTVDGVHPTDLGFYRIAATYRTYLKKFLK